MSFNTVELAHAFWGSLSKLNRLYLHFKGTTERHQFRI